MNLRPLLLTAATALALTGCALTRPIAPADVSAMEIAVSVAETLALNYTRLPACGSAGTTNVCAATATKAAVKAYGQKARDAVVTLRTATAADAPAAMAAAQAALAVLRTSIPAYAKN